MRKYYYYENETGKHRYIHIYKEVNQSECDMCRGMKHFINKVYPERKDEIPAGILNLCKANLKSHLKTGRHWKSVGEEWD